MIQSLLHRSGVLETYTTTKKSKVYIVKDREGIKPRYICKKINKAQNRLDIDKEVNALIALKNNKYVANLEDYYEDDEHSYLLLEYCRGGNLLKLEDKTNLDEEFLSLILRKCMLCILECHQRNIMHGDIKLNNFVANDDTLDDVKLIDFGCASILEDEHQCIDFKTGTPFYMSPENIEGRQCLKSDIWSIGVAGYYLFAKRHPFSTVTFMADSMWNNILMNDINTTPLSTTSGKCQDFFAKVLEKDPEKRISILDALNHPFIDTLDSFIF